MQNQELKNEMDKLRRELQRFREDFQDPQFEKNDTIKKDSADDVDIIEI